VLNSDRVPLGYQHDMPAFSGLLSDEDLANLIEYIKSIGPGPGAGPPPLPAVLPVPGPSPSPVPLGGSARP